MKPHSSLLGILAILSLACLASAQDVGHKCVANCGPGTSAPRSSAPDNSRSDSNSSANTERNQRIARAHELNDLGIAAWNNRDWAKAAKNFKSALGLTPDDAVIKGNLEKAERQLEFADNERKEREEREDREAREKLEREKREAQEKFEREKAEAVNLLKGTSSDLQLKDADSNSSFGLKGIGDSGVKERLSSRDQELSAAIGRDLKAIRDLGFDRRAEDFAEWEKLATDAQAEYENEIKGILTDLVLDKSRDSLLEGFKHFDAAKGERWIAFLESQDPKPVELIAAIRRVSQLKFKGRAAYDAKYIVDAIEKLSKAIHVKDLTTALPVMLDLVCDTVPKQPINKQCKFFRTESKWAVAALYNNAARRVAVNEVERLTQMTEVQLAALRRLNEVLVKHVQERNEVRARLKELE